MFSILIPTWNNLDCLKLCIASIRKFSDHEHEILVHVNDGSDGTLNWVRAENLRYTRSTQNVGVCIATNCLAGQATRDWLLYMNDDMVCCPGWDSALLDAAHRAGSNLAMFFSTLIEPTETGNPLVVVRDFGRGPQDFDADGLLSDHATPVRDDIHGVAAQPTLVHRASWHAVGGYSLEFGPGMSSDDDLLMKFWVAGCRTFQVVGASRLYHFGCRSTNRIRRNRGGRTFVMKWGITQREFKQRFLAKCGKDADKRSLKETFPCSTPLGRLRRIAYTIGDFPLHDLAAWDVAPGRHLVYEPD
jgi:GT2 family glycosyltransferase